MLYYLHMLEEVFSPLRVFQYITVRTFAAGGTAFVLSLCLGPWVIRRLTALKVGQQVRREHVESLHTIHGKKQGTPTMGGVLILLTLTLSTLLWAASDNLLVWMALATTLYMGAIGFLDDYLKISRRSSGGLGARYKLLLQGLWAVFMALALLNWPDPEVRRHARALMVPFLKTPLVPNIGLLGVMVFIWLVVVGASNAVNLTDGLDGLAIGCTNSVAMAYTVLAYVAGHAVIADYLQVPSMAGSGELAVFCGALLGSGLGFLWWNCHPARMFMGDTGSLALGGAIAAVAVLIKQEVLLIIVGGVFVVEALSVVLQVFSFKTRGKRIFKCSPIHHHFELLEKERAEKEGRDLEVVETMIVTRFWIVSVVFALIGLATLKLR